MSSTQQDLPLPPRPTPREFAGEFEQLPIALIKVRPQARKHFDEEKLRALADSVHEQGVVQPVIVRWVSSANAYEIVAGERRLRASIMCGLGTIPAIKRDDLSDNDALTIQIIENKTRADLTVWEEVEAIGQLIDSVGLAEAARRLSIPSLSTASRISGARTLWQPARKLIEDGKLDGVDIAHELAKLANLDEDCAFGLVQAFYTPRPHNPAPPTRKEIRSLIDIKRNAIELKAQTKQEQTRLEMARDNERGHDSTAGDERPAPKAKAPASDETPPPESKAGKEMAQRIEADNSERQALVDAAALVADRLRLAAQHAFGVEQRPDPNDEYSTGASLWSLSGREITDDLMDGDPVIVRAMNVQLARFPGDAGSILDVRYTLNVELPLCSETELMQLLAGLSTGGQPAPTGLLLRPDEQTVADFIADLTEPREGDKLKSDWLHERYEKWSKKRKTPAVDEGEFSRVMKLLGREKKRYAPGRFYDGIGLKEGVK